VPLAGKYWLLLIRAGTGTTASRPQQRSAHHLVGSAARGLAKDDRGFVWRVMLRAWRYAVTIDAVKAKRALARIVTDESLDLYILAATAFIFTILGATGVSSLTDLASMILALLAILALSQIRSRHHVSAIAAAQRSDPFSVLTTDFPPDLIAQRSGFRSSTDRYDYVADCSGIKR